MVTAGAISRGTGVRTERRRHIRFLAQENAFAALRTSFTRVGRIKNISVGGLAFEYITDEESNQEGSQIDIFISGNGFHLPKVPCAVVYDIPARSPFGDGMFYHTFMSKQCGVQFGELTQDEKEQLDLFLAKHTVGLAPGTDDA